MQHYLQYNRSLRRNERLHHIFCLLDLLHITAYYALKKKIDSSQWANLEDSGSSGNSIVSDSGVATGQHNVGLAANWRSSLGRLWDGHGETTIDSSCRGENGTSDGDESSINLRLAISGGND